MWLIARLVDKVCEVARREEQPVGEDAEYHKQHHQHDIHGVIAYVRLEQLPQRQRLFFPALQRRVHAVTSRVLVASAITFCSVASSTGIWPVIVPSLITYSLSLMPRISNSSEEIMMMLMPRSTIWFISV